MARTMSGPDGVERCHWCTASDRYISYHDDEWGYPVSDDIRLFEKICLEGFQSGLSWLTILNKRDNFRAAFDGFDFRKMAGYGKAEVERLLGDAGIVRHRGKIEAVINNAARACELIEEKGSLAAYFWSFEPAADTLDAPQSVSVSDTSKALSKDLRKRGWKFVGPTTAYAFMQAMGLINDHAEGCAMRDKARLAREAFTPPA